MGLCLFFLSNFPGATFIQGATFIPDSRVLGSRVLFFFHLHPTGHTVGTIAIRSSCIEFKHAWSYVTYAALFYAIHRACCPT